MMRKVITVILAVAFFGCGKKEDSKTVDKSAIDKVTIATPAVGAGQDAHGCKSSAGYTWSELSGECIRVFEKARRFDPYDNANNTKMPAFAIFKGDSAEVFIQTEKPFIAVRRSEGSPFVYGAWELIPWKGYVLKKDGKILFTGK